MDIRFLYEFLIPLMYVFIIIYVVLFVFVMIRKEKRKYMNEEKKRYTFDICIKLLKELNKLDIKSQGQEIDTLLIYNRIASGVNRGVLSEDVVKSFYESDFEQMYNQYGFLMASFRNAKRNPYYFNELDILIQRWKRNNDENERTL